MVRASKGFSTLPKRKRRDPQSVQVLKEKVWKQYSLYIRLRDADWKGMVRCVTCGATKHFREMQAGHFIPARHPSVVFDERNCHPQCSKCNVFLHSNPRKYDAFMRQKYGEAVIKELEELDEQIKQFTPDELKQLLQLYQRKAAKLLKKYE
jgi:hypothetical protein